MENKDLEKTQLWHQTIVRAWTDNAFHEKLISDPQAVLEELGLVAKGERVILSQLERNVVHLTLPQRPKDFDPKSFKLPETDDVDVYFERLPKVLAHGPGSKPCSIPGGCSWMS